MKNLFLLIPTCLLLSCADPTAGAANPGTSPTVRDDTVAPAKKDEGAPRSTPSTIWVTAHSGTLASPGMPAPPPDAPAPPPRPTQYRIQPVDTGGYEVVEVLGAKDGRHAPIADAEVAKLVALAKSLQDKVCEGSHSAHNDPEVHFAGEVQLDALGGIGLACPPSATCDQCKATFASLHSAVLSAAQHALQ